MEFRLWLEAEEEDIRKIMAQARKEREDAEINRQGGLGRMVKKAQGVWMVPFNTAEKDQVEGWFFNWFENPGSIPDLKEVEIGDKIADMTPNMTPYWTVNGVDEKKGRIYLTPIKPNPFLSGVGAGGHKFTQHDYDVQSGQYERDVVGRILDDWKNGHVRDISDIKYLLLGTVPSQMGPNGAQGGWYAVGDGHTRGARKQMGKKEIMMQDAKTIRDTFGFDVPTKALSGEMDIYDWNQFVGGSDDTKPGMEIEGEDFSDPQAMAKMILTHPQPQIKKRNASRLISMYRGGYKTEADPSIGPLVKEVAKRLNSVFVSGQDKLKNFDPYWNTKESFITLADREGWDDILERFEDAPDATNRRYVFEAYAGTFPDGKRRPEKMWKMLDKETTAQNLAQFLGGVAKDPDKKSMFPDFGNKESLQRSLNILIKVQDWVDDNREKVDKAIKTSHEYYVKELENVLDTISTNIKGYTRMISDDRNFQ